MKKVLSFLGMVVVTISITATASGSPVEWRGHWYEVISQSVNWTTAKEMAEGMEWQGMTGHLATITSEAEHFFIMGLSYPFWETWIGGYQNVNSSDYTEPGGGWEWITGEKWTYSPPGWGISDEPNNNLKKNFNEEWCLEMGTWGGWNDYPANGINMWMDPQSFIVEYETQSQTTTPEPNTLILLVIGLITISILGKKVKIDGR